MSVLHTIRSGYEPLRAADVTADDPTTFDGTTAGRRYFFTDKPAAAKYLGPEYNGCDIFFTSGVTSLSNPDVTTAVNSDPFEVALWGWASGGPAQKICDISGMIGNGWAGDVSTALYCCSLTVVVDKHLSTVTAIPADNSQQVARLHFDTGGYEYIYMQVVDTSTPLNGWIRPY